MARKCEQTARELRQAHGRFLDTGLNRAERRKRDRSPIATNKVVPAKGESIKDVLKASHPKT